MDPPFLLAYATASAVAWLVSPGRSVAAASAAASAIACWARCARYHVPVSIAKPAMPQTPTMPSAVRASTWPRCARNLPRKRLIATPLVSTPVAAQAWFLARGQPAGKLGSWQSLVGVLAVPRTVDSASTEPLPEPGCFGRVQVTVTRTCPDAVAQSSRTIRTAFAHLAVPAPARPHQRLSHGTVTVTWPGKTVADTSERDSST